jgi:hypothetical protein
VAAVADDLRLPDGMASDGVEVVEAEDVLLSGAPAWPSSHVQRMPAAWADHDRASLLTLAPDGSDHDRTPQPIDQLLDLELEAEAVFTAHMLASQSDDSATALASASSSSRQSA